MWRQKDYTYALEGLRVYQYVVHNAHEARLMFNDVSIRDLKEFARMLPSFLNSLMLEQLSRNRK